MYKGKIRYTDFWVPKKGNFLHFVIEIETKAIKKVDKHFLLLEIFNTGVWPVGYQDLLLSLNLQSPERFDLPCTNVYNTCWYSVGHFDTGVGHRGLGDPLDAGKHALQLLGALSVVSAEVRTQSLADNKALLDMFLRIHRKRQLIVLPNFD